MIAPGLGSETANLVAALAEPASRASAARVLARHFGAEDMLLFVRDPEIGALLPASGFAQTIRGGSDWRRLLGRCSEFGRHRAEVDLPPDARIAATAVSCGTAAAVLLGGVPSDDRLAELESLLPLLAAMLAAEQRIAIAAAESAVAREAADRAQTLASALEIARAEGAKLNAELREEHRRKDEFLSMLANELRTPLAPLRNSVQILRAKAQSVPELQWAREVIDNQVQHMSRLVDDLADMSRAGAGAIELRRERVALASAINAAVEMCRPMIEESRHQLMVSIPVEPIHVNADPTRLAQVIANLLHNAVKYTDAPGRIEVVLERDGGEGVVRVTDNGVGIPPEMLDRVFEIFTQIDRSRERAQGGLGLGLTLARQLVELHGGRIEARSEGTGKGSQFVVRLPAL